MLLFWDMPHNPLLLSIFYVLEFMTLRIECLAF
eukprot:UN18928